MINKQTVSTTPTMLPPELLAILQRAAGREESEPFEGTLEYSAIDDIYDNGVNDGERSLAQTVFRHCGIPLEQ